MPPPVPRRRAPKVATPGRTEAQVMAPRAPGVYTLVIPDWRPTTLNVLMRMHWGKANRAKQSDAGMLATYARLHEVPPATGRRRVSVRTVLTGRQKPTDPDALWKVLLDGLVKCRQLVDDTAALVELGPVTSERGDRTATVITLEDL